MSYIPHFQTSFFTPEFADPSCIEEGTVPWLLKTHGDLLFPAWLFARWSGAGERGRNAWAPTVLMTALLLAASEGGNSRRGMVRRLRRDVTWRAACGLDIGGPTPDEATFRRFERYLRGGDSDSGVVRAVLLHEHIVRVCVEENVVGQNACWMMDSTPMWCFGAFQGTFRLLGDGLRSLGRSWARLTGVTMEKLAAEWEVPLFLAKSTKGHFRIDWKDPDARADATNTLVQWVVDVVRTIRRQLDFIRSNKRKKLLRRCRSLLKIIESDLEVDEDGRFVVAQRVAPDRIVSVTDPQARSSRKSKSQAYKGFKVHILGDLVSGLIASVTVTRANIGDGGVARRLMRRAQRVCDELTEVLGDTAYGGAELHLLARKLEGVDILAPPHPVHGTAGRFTSADFDIAATAGKATCPAGITVDLRITQKSQFFSWKKEFCDGCPLAESCLGKGTKSKTVLLHPYHDELMQIRDRWDDPKFREQYRARSQGERLVHGVVRRGARRARAWGLQTANLQVCIAAIANNLALLAKVLATREQTAKAA